MSNVRRLKFNTSSPSSLLALPSWRHGSPTEGSLYFAQAVSRRGESRSTSAERSTSLLATTRRSTSSTTLARGGTSRQTRDGVIPNLRSEQEFRLCTSGQIRSSHTFDRSFTSGQVQARCLRSHWRQSAWQSRPQHRSRMHQTFHSDATPNPSIERTPSSVLRTLPAAAHVQR